MWKNAWRSHLLAAILTFGLPLTSAVAAAPSFDTANLRRSAPNTIPEMRIVFAKGRYEIRNATLVDLIRTAWGRGRR
jgi:hypothetical protein